MADEALLRCRELVVGYPGRPLLPPIDVAIARGHFVVVVGRNGSGKSTWLKTLLGETPPLGGTIERSEALKHVAYVPQTAVLDRILPMKAQDVVMQGRLHCNNFLRPFPSRRDAGKAREALEEAGASALANETFRALSKGQRQRVMFARMLATECELALLDEPTAAMDVLAEREAIDHLAALAKSHGIAVVLVTHALEIVETHADDVLFFDRTASRVIFGARDEVLGHRLYRSHLRGERIDPEQARSERPPASEAHG